ncbi:hypothetical protein SAMN02746089_01813 [Caldanaerobius fijiensis DSM 17918]|uniref:Uncharacterized protein n=1 Tax=Caldanaerobius fijiensis DSM 17918 TaxID=1121256 RepID=A0A1M5B7W2_9THEO|nr:hypothetical protein [Caldanaerobius fijiensis]SHF38614.1 hypothetical protein SAMN02746089_01813 [Caldanaerobius fijiensis DSM 17918]
MRTLKVIGSRSFFWGIGFAILSYLLYPKAKEAIAPVLLRKDKSARDIRNMVRDAMNETKESVTDMFKKEQTSFESNQDYNAQIEFLKLEKENALKQINELNAKINALEQQINAIKNG